MIKDVNEILKQNDFAVSKIKITVFDRRSEETITTDIYRFGETFTSDNVRRTLDLYGYDLIKSEVVSTQYGEFSIKKLFEIFSEVEE